MKTILSTPFAGVVALSIFVATFSPALADQQTLHPKAAAVAYLKASNQSDVVGTVQFIPVKNGVRIIAHVMNLSPGEHGFHVHERGDLSAPDLSSAGGRYNPTKDPHASPDAKRRHMGDLANITVDANGTATIDRIDPKLSLEGQHSIIERSVIIHANPDDFTSQPSGNAGDRVAGGIIQKIRR